MEPRDKPEMGEMSRRELVKGMALGGVASVALAPGILQAAGSEGEVAGGDWPVYRHDAALTASSPLRGGFAQAPRVAWSLDLGGPSVPSERLLVQDVTGDGRDDILELGEETVTCREARGRLLWKLDGLPNSRVVDVRDYAGDGSRGILLTTSVAGKAETHMVAGRTGRAVHLWRDENNFGGHTRYGRLLSGVRGAQVASTASGTTPPEPWGGHVRLVSFERGLEHPHFHVRRFVAGTLYSPLILFADMDADGRAEMVVISHEELWTFDPETGEQKFHAQYAPTIRTYSATIAAVKLTPQDRCPDLVMISPHIPGLKAVRQDGKSAATARWKVVIGGKEDQYQGKIRITPAGPDVVADLGGDGRYQILAQITNEHDDGQQHLVVFDALTGRRLAEGADARVLSVDDLDGDGKPEVLLAEGDQLRVARWTGDGFHDLWRGEHVQPVLEPLPQEADLTRTAGGNPLLRRAAPGSHDFLMQFADGISSCRLTAAGVERIKSAGPAKSVQAAIKQETVTLEGHAAVTRVEGREVYRYEPPAPQTYLAPPPLVADLGKARRILVRDAGGRYLRCSPGGKQEQVLIDRLFEKFQNHVDAGGAGPAVCDVDGDGENEVVATVSEGEGAPACVILDAEGRVKRRIELIPGTRVMNRGPTGSLGPGRGRWIILRMFYGEGAYQGRYPVVAAYDGKTGQQFWVRDHYSTYGPNPAIFAAHLPTAVFDYDGDGVDDWMVCSENFYGIISVRDNRDLVAPVILSDEIPGHWTAYSYPSLVDLNGDGRLAAFHHSAYSLTLVTDLAGQALWHYGMTRDTGGAWGLALDVDGDGKQEILHVQPDGVVRCFEPAAMAGKCPSCPTDAALTAVNHGGRQRWEIDMHRPVSRLVAADLDGDGRREALFGCGDGKLYALGERKHRPHLLWSLPLGRRVGEPVIADVDRDGKAEILVPVEDGRLYCLRASGAAT
jgi:hypothetical protein